MNMDLFSKNATVVLVHGAWADGSSWNPPLQVNVSGAIWQSNDLGDAKLLSGISVHRHRPEPISLRAGARLP
jgi:hypothetical protein